MSWREEVLGTVRERTLENAQVRPLARRYDLSRGSRGAGPCGSTSRWSLRW